MKTFKKALPAEPRPDPAAVLALAAQTAPTFPPAQIAPSQAVGQLNLKVKASLIDQLAARAAADGTSQKAIVCRALAAAGFEVHPDDLENRTNHRRPRLGGTLVTR
jgi:hypothetical protein